MSTRINDLPGQTHQRANLDADQCNQNTDKRRGERMPYGNWQGKRRKNLYLTADADQMLYELCAKMGLNDGGVLEVAIRQLYAKEVGEFEWSRPADLRSRRAKGWAKTRPGVAFGDPDRSS